MQKNILLLLAFLLLTGHAVQAQAVKGQIILPVAQSDQRVQVLLEKSDGQAVARTYTDSQGNFTFASTLNSDCYIVIHLEGYNDVRERVVVSSGGSIRVLINLTKKDAAADRIGSPGSEILDSAPGSRYSKKILDDYEKAQADNRNGNAAKAASRLQDLLKQTPDFYEAHNTLGTVFQKLERFDDAEKEYSIAHVQNSLWDLPLENLGRLHLQIAESRPEKGAAVVEGFLTKARQELQEAIALNPRSAMSHYVLGAVCYRMAAYPESEGNLKRALELEPGMSRARLMSINLYVRLQKWPEALDQIDRYLGENPAAAEREQIQGIRAKVVEKTGPPASRISPN